MPNSFRWALVAAVVLGFQMSLTSLFDLQEVWNVESSVLHSEEVPLPGLGLSVSGQRAVWLAIRSAYQTALQNMRPWRLGSSALLTLAGAGVFVYAMRLRLGQPQRAMLAQRLGLAALAVAALRSMDGAQSLAIVRTRALAVAKVLVSENIPDAETLGSVITVTQSLMSVGWSMVMVGVFVALSSYFRNGKLQQTLALEEPPPEA